MRIIIMPAVTNGKREWRVYVNEMLTKVFFSELEALQYKLNLLNIQSETQEAEETH